MTIVNPDRYTVYKYPFFVADDVEVQLPKGARILHVAQQPMQPADLVLWAHVDRDAPLVTRKLKVYGTGHDMPGDAGTHLATVLCNGGALVWHIYDLGEEK